MNDSDAFTGDPIREEVRVLVLIVGWLSSISGTLGNVLVISTLLTQPLLRSIHNLYIGNLAIADLIISVYIIPSWMLDFSLGRHPVSNTTHCLINSYIMGSGFSTSLLTLVAISVNRYLHVCHSSLFLTVFTKQRTLLLCVLTWVLGCLICLPNVLSIQPESLGYYAKLRFCFFKDTDPNNYLSMCIVTLLLLTSIIVGFCNLAIFWHWRSSRLRLHKWQVRSETAYRGNADGPQRPCHHSEEVNEAGQQTDENKQYVQSDTTNCNTCLIKNCQPTNGICTEHPAGPALSSAGDTSDSKQSVMKNQSAVNFFKEHSQTNEAVFPAGVNEHNEKVSRLLSSEPTQAENPRNEIGLSEKMSNFLFKSEHPKGISDQPKVTTTSQHHHSRLSASDISLILSLLIVFVCCVVLFLPVAVVTILNTSGVYIPAEIHIWIVVCGVSNHTINWIIYGLMNKNFRDGYRRQLIFCCKKCGMKL